MQIHGLCSSETFYFIRKFTPVSPAFFGAPPEDTTYFTVADCFQNNFFFVIFVLFGLQITFKDTCQYGQS